VGAGPKAATQRTTAIHKERKVFIDPPERWAWVDALKPALRKAFFFAWKILRSANRIVHA
jgi:lysozyme family protein